MMPNEDARATITPEERARRILALVHTALLASVGIYGVILVFLQSEIQTVRAARPDVSALFLVLAAVGILQFGAAAALGRAFLRFPRSRPLDRVRLSFLLRAAAAEAIALYGLILGFLGGSVTQVGALFALAVAALLSCAPGHAAWDAALRRTGNPPPG